MKAARVVKETIIKEHHYHEKQLVPYYPQPYYVKTLITNGSATRLDQINYAQGFVSGR